MVRFRPIVEELRRVREEISEQIGPDPKRIVEYYCELQESVKDRTFNLNDQSKHRREWI